MLMQSVILSTVDFKRLVASAPLVSIDLIIKNDRGDLLLGLRRNKPACGFWFTPGGRIRKGESQSACIARLLVQELGFEEVPRYTSSLLGVWDHFYSDSIFSDSMPTHYVNIGYAIKLNLILDFHFLPDSQHLAWAFWTIDEIAKSSKVHENVKRYVESFN